MAQSMTGFASKTGEIGSFSWNWDIRSVNARGLDVRLRLPDWIPGLEEALRAALKGKVTRGNVTVGLRVSRADDAGQLSLNAEELTRVISLLEAISAEARARGVDIAPASATEIAAMRGVLEITAGNDAELGPLTAALKAQVSELIEEFVAARTQEGAALIEILSGQVNEVSALVDQAEALLDSRQEAQRETLAQNLARVVDNAEGLDPDRIAQELAMIAVKTDVREELDRLRAHVSAARDLLAGTAPAGRKLDFLMQEFNREANTLCSKAQFKALTAVGLDLKHVIDQMREQVQNLE